MRLADFVLQHGPTARCFDIAPAEFWEAACDYLSDPHDLGMLARSARQHHHFRFAFALFEQPRPLGMRSLSMRSLRGCGRQVDRPAMCCRSLTAALAGEGLALEDLERHYGQIGRRAKRLPGGEGR